MDANSEADPKSLADILEEELHGVAGWRSTQNIDDEEDDDAALARKQQHLHQVYDAIFARHPLRSALCLSGGGIRSAMFSLGVLQGLARKNLLGKFDYLSTVSGGGYVGGWLTAWIKNHPEGMNGVERELSATPDFTLNPEPAPIRHLRAFSNYLTPKVGFGSVDSWTLIATYLRNVFLNGVLIISWLAALMMLPRLYLGAILLPPSTWTSAANHLELERHYNFALHLVLGVSLLLIAVAMAYAIVDVPATGNAKLAQKRFLWWRQGPLFAASLGLSWWWACYSNLHGNAAFDGGYGLLKFTLFAMGTYFLGGILGGVYLHLAKQAWFPWKIENKPDVSGKRKRFAEWRRLAAVLGCTALGSCYLWLIATRVFPNPSRSALNYVCFAPAFVVAMFVLVNFLFTGLASRLSEDPDREWWARSAAWLLINICAWSAITALVLWGAQAISPSSQNRLVVFLGDVQATPVAKSLLGAFGGVTGLVGALLGLRSKFSKQLGRSSALRWILMAAAFLFFLLLSIVISWALLFVGAQSWMEKFARSLAFWSQAYQVQLLSVFILITLTLSLGILLGFVINVNKFSLHATYRMRLIRAFLGASRPRGARQPHLFTGFDPEDNFPLRDIDQSGPFHIINATLNLVKGHKLAWQERKGESFTMSRLHCGSWHLGYRPSAAYGEEISLGTALTISGAAASPNMGYHSSALLSFLMTLFNVRLGCWLGNPGQAGAKTWRRAGPLYAVGPLFSEALGNTDDCYKYVNLSDGGHFENLGLYEMVLRRCRCIIVVDACQDFDYTYEDLGNAIRKIRIDLGIPIELKLSPPDKKKKETVARCAYGKILYSEVDRSKPDGEIIYLKPVIAGDEPPDVYNYAAAHPEFPHEPTLDQWFSESQLESYRLLGLHSIKSIDPMKWDANELPNFCAFAGGLRAPAPIQAATLKPA